MKLVALGIALVSGWLIALLLFVNYFSETDRAGGDVVIAASWVLLVLGVLSLVSAPVVSWRRRTRRGGAR